ncbi:unnamed protein product [Effrenium voratum]|nr:unnamed protein product [Effrenium voratum]CAJ1422853.1 unnamed protein product [Effrenium voratum]
MALLRYRWTFIDAENVEDAACGRSSSCPAAFRSQEFLRAARQLRREETQLAAQVAQLLAPKNDSWTPANFVPNVGSLGHPNLCQRRCCLMRDGVCPKGAACEYCHLPHCRSSLDKRQRCLLSSASETQLLRTLQPHFARHGMENPAALPLQELLARELAVRPQEEQSLRCPNLERTLTRLSLAALAGLVCAHTSGRLPGLMREALAELRELMA